MVAVLGTVHSRCPLLASGVLCGIWDLQGSWAHWEGHKARHGGARPASASVSWLGFHRQQYSAQSPWQGCTACLRGSRVAAPAGSGSPTPALSCSVIHHLVPLDLPSSSPNPNPNPRSGDFFGAVSLPQASQGWAELLSLPLTAPSPTPWEPWMLTCRAGWLGLLWVRWWTNAPTCLVGPDP